MATTSKPAPRSPREQDLRSALAELLIYATGNGSDRTGNPHMKREVQSAQKAIGTDDIDELRKIASGK